MMMRALRMILRLKKLGAIGFWIKVMTGVLVVGRQLKASEPPRTDAARARVLVEDVETERTMTEAAEGNVCAVIGAGDGLGAAVARAFAREGLAVCVTRRPRHTEDLEKLAESIRAEGGEAHAIGLDARREADVAAFFETVERTVGPIEALVFNIGANVRFPVVETTAQVYSKVWEMACFAGFLVSREAAKVMAPRGRGTILFTGATASVRGGAEFSAFAGAKHGLRALAQSLARELGPKGIHVAHVVIDGAI